MALVGIDGCVGGWIAVVIREGGLSLSFLANIGELSVAVPDVEVVAIDIPIGLPPSGRRAADVEGKQRLGARASTLFYAPVRESLLASSFDEANRLAREKSGYGLSRQTFGLFSKIREVDEWLDSAPCDVREVHPELSFAGLAGHVMPASKKSWTGMSDRRRALKGAGFVLDRLDDKAGRLAGADDVLDAAVAAWSARRISEGRACSIPGVPETDSHGRQMAIWV
jgi:predicted RNase H-like nuclease